MKRIITLVSLIALLLTAFATKPNTSEEPEQILSNVSAKDCYLCGNGLKDFPYWGQNNVGIISLNTFEIMPVEINRYDDNGNLMEETAGYMSSFFIQNQENGFLGHVYADPDFDQASGSITLNDDDMLDQKKAAAYLCQDCLNSVFSERNPSGVGAINLMTKELCLFDKQITDINLGDYSIDCDWKESMATDSQELDFHVLYSPENSEKGTRKAD